MTGVWTWAHRALFLPAVLGLAACGGDSVVSIASGIDHSAWNRLLHKYVDGRGLVDYARWKADADDMTALRAYLARIAAPASEIADGTDADASLINAYNALVIAWVLDNYPTPSIRHLPGSFSRARHTVAGRLVSLDAIEHATLRPQLGFLTHGALVCASRSCPPLAAEAYSRDQLANQLAFALRRWLDRQDLNEFLPYENRAYISPVFRWYADDFDKAPGGLRGVLSLYAPARFKTFLAKSKYAIRYQSFDWGLNDQGPAGRGYGRWRAFWDRVWNR
ncbi:MAG TPA: DUF547 domain-containing protein [Thermoanaerobaculia bacterium]